MNFSDLRFWSTLFWAVSGWLVLRRLAAGRWPLWGDGIALLGTSLWLFAEASKQSFLLFIVDVALNTMLARLIARAPESRGRLLLIAGVTSNLLLLAFFKYRYFLAHDVLGLPVLTAPKDIPPGISFYTFQMVGFLVDTYRARRKGDQSEPNPIDFYNFVSFFPHIVAGPIQRRHDLMPQVVGYRFRPSLENTALAVRWCALGLFAKMVLADTLAEFTKDAAATSAYGVIWSTFLFGLRIYFDFAGYSFLAVGLARFLGIQLAYNFLAPYQSTSVREFWQRWHVTLGSWFRDYLYLPLGGGRVPHWGVNLMVVFLLSGLWHGASWNFVFWGAYHGALLVGHRLVEGHVRPPAWAARIITQTLVFAGWLLFMDADTAILRTDLALLISPSAFHPGAVLSVLPDSITAKATLALILLLSFAFLLAEGRSSEEPYRRHLRPGVSLAMVVLTVIMVGNRTTEFIYFAF